MKPLRLLLLAGLALAVPACGTKSRLLTPQCSREERAQSGTAAPTDPNTVCGKLSKTQKDPSEPPNPITR